MDYGRLVAAMGIVWFHSQAPGARLAYAALPFFLVLLATPSRAGLRVRAQRLLLPFLRWSAIYAALGTALSLRHHQPPLGWWDWPMLLTGTSLHLWFLPFAFLVAMLTPMLTRRKVAPIAALWGAAAFCLFGTPEGIPLAQWSFGLIPVLVGIAYFTNGWRIAAATLILCWLMLTLGRPSADNVTILAGTGIALVVLAVRVAPTRLSSWCAGLSMWVYLAHPLILVAGRTAGLSGFALGIFAILGSLLLAQGIEAAMPRRPRARYIDKAAS
ncbi:acyltransferase family protein [Paracoccus sp. DMF]|uniref:acyltransferase family protein n=1 Tax=Paracoccus sp. DMF TaxID=400837 RepID=UPI00110136C7|nr:acyltransferase family protein [Paracoccus sp. DMF]MCV2447107.1 hypothetical protein [Paracoccus sp. DMF]